MDERGGRLTESRHEWGERVSWRRAAFSIERLLTRVDGLALPVVDEANVVTLIVSSQNLLTSKSK
ncbi:MAG: hypothetical protein CBE00_07910 [Planctomycetaceae bacterium TMED240]|nr:hypothetical protein [Rhodopirellula sp.]OUX06332.1 MAG: hypothetical protein CBE00_07910 [Planctomycetaceae bacterium TMED240]